MTDFNNASDHKFVDISSEDERIYNFGNKGFVKIRNPVLLSVSESGGHRLFSEDGVSHYVPSGWIELTWTTKTGKPNFVK